LGWHVCHAGQNAAYKWAQSLPRQIQATYADGAKLTEDEVLDRLVRVQLLIVEEVSVTSGSDFGTRILSEIICRRHDKGRDTILISVQSEEDFAQSVGESITDRIAEGGGIYTFNWPSFRRSAPRPAP
jgi:DNA replication protein DnaC